MNINEHIHEYVSFSEEMKKLKTRQDVLKEAVKAHMKETGVKKLNCEAGMVTISQASRETVDKKSLKEYLGKSFAQFAKNTPYEVVKIQSHESAEAQKQAFEKISEKEAMEAERD